MPLPVPWPCGWPRSRHWCPGERHGPAHMRESTMPDRTWSERLTRSLSALLLVVLLVVVVAPLIIVMIGSVIDTSILGLTSESWQQDASAWSWFSYVLELY